MPNSTHKSKSKKKATLIQREAQLIKAVDEVANYAGALVGIATFVSETLKAIRKKRKAGGS